MFSDNCKSLGRTSMKCSGLFTRKGIINLALIFSLIMITSFITGTALATERTVGVLLNERGASHGYNLFYPITNTEHIYLINKAGNVCHTWDYPHANGSKYLLENGNLLTLGWANPPDRIHGGMVQILDWESVPIWTFEHPYYSIHHDVRPLPNGNILMIAESTISWEEAVEAGAIYDNVVGAPEIRMDNVIEVNPCGKIVWAWHVMDHLVQDNDETKANYGVVGDDPGLIDINFVLENRFFFGYPVNRFNALDYNPELDQIVLSASLSDEIWIIDRNTTTAEAAGARGDLLFRWGNPVAYDADASPDDQRISFQHNVQWIDEGLPGEGNILIFNNGSHLGYSQALEIAPVMICNNYDMNNAVDIWSYEDPPEDPNINLDPDGLFSGSYLGGIQRLPNGNTLICQGPGGILFEMTPKKNMVWKYRNPLEGGVSVEQGIKPWMGFPTPNADVYRVTRYAPDYPGLAGKNLTPGDPIEQYPNMYSVDIKPRSCRNPVNRKSKGVLPVAILGSEDLDVTTIDPDSILLEGFPAKRWSIRDVSALDKCHGIDGYPDLVLKWDSKLIKNALRNVSKGDSSLLRLTGYSSGGWFMGMDEVVRRPRHGPHRGGQHGKHQNRQPTHKPCNGSSSHR